MQAYGRAFARVYNLRWGDFARQVAPLILDFYASTPPGQAALPVLDLCCGAGQLALYFLEKGYWLTGVDLSEPMLEYAKENAGQYVRTGQARFVCADAASFTLEERFGLVVSTYDALNHLENMQALQGCFCSVYAVLADGGYFVFDLNTRNGLMQNWNGISVQDTPEIMVVNRGVYDDRAGRALVRISGFLRNPDGLYERFEETVFNTAFELQAVRQALLDAGWQAAHCAQAHALETPLDDPEAERRVFFVAHK